jgi:hypothetical protein
MWALNRGPWLTWCPSRFHLLFFFLLLRLPRLPRRHYSPMRTFATSMDFSQTALFFDLFPVFNFASINVCLHTVPLYDLRSSPYSTSLGIIIKCLIYLIRPVYLPGKNPGAHWLRGQGLVGLKKGKHLALVGIRTSPCPSCSLFTMHITLSTTDYVPLTLRNWTETAHRDIRVYPILRNFCFTQVKYTCPAKSEIWIKLHMTSKQDIWPLVYFKYTLTSKMVIWSQPYTNRFKHKSRF